MQRFVYGAATGFEHGKHTSPHIILGAPEPSHLCLAPDCFVEEKWSEFDSGLPRTATVPGRRASPRSRQVLYVEEVQGMGRHTWTNLPHEYARAAVHHHL